MIYDPWHRNFHLTLKTTYSKVKFVTTQTNQKICQSGRIFKLLTVKNHQKSRPYHRVHGHFRPSRRRASVILHLKSNLQAHGTLFTPHLRKPCSHLTYGNLVHSHLTYGNLVHTSPTKTVYVLCNYMLQMRRNVCVIFFKHSHACITNVTFSFL